MAIRDRSLLLVSGVFATVPIGLSSTLAADAIIIEPEPIEYVQVCEAYGSGYFYIPGTETCIRFG